MTDDTFERLAQHLERLPGGFARCDDGADLRLLGMLFEPDQAELALRLSMSPASPAVVASRVAWPVPLVADMLREMAVKGLVVTAQSKDGAVHYGAAPWNIGISDLQINRLSAELLDALDAYYASSKGSAASETIPQMRTIPIGKSLAPDLNVLPYEQVERLIAHHTSFAVSDCYCRQAAKIRGHGCKAPMETCLTFGEWADHYVRTERGRAIDRDEVMRIVALANEHGLILQPSNSREISILCCCCGCCCGILQRLKRSEKPAALVANAFIAQLDRDACVGCKTCLDRCQLDALSADGKAVALNLDRCIGCGLCVSTCPPGALTLARKEGALWYRTPETFHEMQRLLVEERRQS